MAEIYVYGDIDENWGDVSAQDITKQLAALPDSESVQVRINSAGGNVFDGVTIHNALKRHEGEVTVTVDGLAASAASIIAMAGDRVVMGQGSRMMIHSAWTVTMGNGRAHTDAADLLNGIDDDILQIYQQRSGQPLGQLRQMLAEETWMGAELAVNQGFADVVEGQAKPEPQTSIAADLRSDDQKRIRAAKAQIAQMETKRIRASVAEH